MFGVSHACSIGFGMPDNMHCVDEHLLRLKGECRVQLLNVSLRAYMLLSHLRLKT